MTEHYLRSEIKRQHQAHENEVNKLVAENKRLRKEIEDIEEKLMTEYANRQIAG